MSDQYVHLCIRVAGAADSKFAAFGKLSDFCQMIGVDMPELSESVSVEGAVQRLVSEHWWRRVLRRKFMYELESQAIIESRVSLYKSIYVSSEGLGLHRNQKARNRRLLEHLRAVNEEGEEYSLAELADTSVANPENRRNELMCRIAGFENYANELGHVGLFWTITCPSRMHSTSSLSGEPNPKFDGTTPDQAQAYLCGLWACIRSKFQRMGLQPYGFRVVEPQHDGTPHWHVLVFLPLDQHDAATSVVREYALREDGSESGADRHRFKVETIDPEKGSAAGYIAKYISKNIDGYMVDSDLYGQDAKDSAERVTAWASIWNIRQFQQIGGPPVSVWRELRRVKSLSDDEQPLEPAWRAADSGDWCAFIHAMGGVSCGRGNYTVNLNKVWSDEENQYGDPIGWIVNGVLSSGVCVVSRIHEWRIDEVKPGSFLAERATAGPALLRGCGGAERPWSPVNNCTGAEQWESVRPPPNPVF
ncbi:MAG TPA: replication endonuclease [Mariprofundaceae bacterium]|nr:replication endonuclease [Mariprofundaceae bacterium]